MLSGQNGDRKEQVFLSVSYFAISAACHPPAEEGAGRGPAWLALNLTVIKAQKIPKQMAESGSECKQGS